MKNRGFSLIELMIVVAIIMIMGAGGLWGFRNRMYKNEILKMKTEIPTLIGNSTFRIYEKAIDSSKFTINVDKLSVSNVGSNSNYVLKSNLFKFATSPSAILDKSITISAIGTFDFGDDASGTEIDEIEIQVLDIKTNDKVLIFSIQTKENLGVYSLTTSQSSF